MSLFTRRRTNPKGPCYEGIIIAPVLVILFVLILFIDKVKKEGTKHEGE